MFNKLVLTLEFIFVTICKVIKGVFPWVSPKADPLVCACVLLYFRECNPRMKKRKGGNETKKNRKPMQMTFT